VSTSTKSSACLGTHQSCVFEQGCEEVAPAYVFLASEADSSYITGELLPVIGGMPYGS
jgi:NAD(P)-dependent dehydrogenase (short-subunit alcohol dehydrogenase family)